MVKIVNEYPIVWHTIFDKGKARFKLGMTKEKGRNKNE